MDHVDHELKFGFLLLVVRNVLRLGADGFGLGAIHPLPRQFELTFHIADGLEVFLDALAVGAADLAVQMLGAVADEIEHAAAFIDAAHFGIHLGGCGREEELLKHRRGLTNGGNGHAVGSDGKRLALRGQGKTLVARLAAILGGKSLVHRDGVFQVVRVIGIGRSREHHGFRLVPAAAGIGVAQTADHREVIAKGGEMREVRRQRVIAASGDGHKGRRLKAERHADANHAARRGGGSSGQHGLQHRQANGDAGALEKEAA